MDARNTTTQPRPHSFSRTYNDQAMLEVGYRETGPLRELIMANVRSIFPWLYVPTNWEEVGFEIMVASGPRRQPEKFVALVIWNAKHDIWKKAFLEGARADSIPAALENLLKTSCEVAAQLLQQGKIEDCSRQESHVQLMLSGGDMVERPGESEPESD